MLNKWGEYIGRWQVRKSLSRRESEPIDLARHPFREVWALCTFDHKETLLTVQQLLERLRNERGAERTSGFVLLHEEEAPDMETVARNIKTIRPKDMSWTGKLKWDPLQSSDQGGPDILIDLTDGSSVAMDRLMSELPAGLRVGPYNNERTPFYDLMVETRGDEEVKDLCDRILRYLELMMEKKN